MRPNLASDISAAHPRLAIDPNCSMAVDEASALRVEYDGETFYASAVTISGRSFCQCLPSGITLSL